MLYFQKKSKDQEMNFEQTKQEELQIIGEYLKQSRLDKNLDLSMVSQKIHLPISVLNALENADLTKLPELVFIQKLLKKYANFLNIAENSIDDKIDNLIIRNSNKNSQTNIKDYLLNINLGYNKFWLYPVYGILLFLAINSLNNILQSSQVAINNNLSNSETIKISNSEENNNPKPEVIPVVETNKENTSIADKLILKISVKEECWLRVIADGKIIFEELIQEQFEQEWIAEEKIIIRAGNAGAIQFSLNGATPELLGKLGQVEQKTFNLPQES